MSARALAAGLFVALTTASAAAQDPGELWRQAQEAERSGDPEQALEAYRAITEGAPTGRLANRARRRIDYLDARGEGAFDPLGRVMEVRRDPSEEAIGRLERELEDFPAGRVRQEARALMASSWLTLGFPERAVDAYRGLLAEPGLPEPDAGRARAGLARALQAAGRPGEALTVLEAEGEQDGVLYQSITRDARATVGSWIALGVIAFFLLWLAWRTGLRPLVGVRPRHLALFAWVLGVPLVIATAYDAEAMDTFGWLAAASAPVLLGAVALGHQERSRRLRWLGAAAACSAELAVAYLVLVERGAVLGVGP